MGFEHMYLGIDIGGTNIGLGLVAQDGTIRHRSFLKTRSYKTLDALAEAIHGALAPIRAQYDIQGIGIGAPTANAQTGCLHYAANLPWRNLEPIKQIFEQRFQLPVALANDANVAALGEHMYGAARGLQHFAVITLGTGVGSGIIVNGGLIVGQDGNAAEFGHNILQPNGRQCGCGRKGCLETYCSAQGIVATAQELAMDWQGSSGLKSDLEAGRPTSAKNIYEYAVKGDGLAKEVWALTGDILGLAMANMVTLLGLEAIFLMGGPTKSGDLLLAPVRQSFNSNVLFYYKDKVSIAYSQLPENDIAILGAASIAAAYRNPEK